MVADGVVNAATARIRLILEQLALLEKQIREADQAIDNLLTPLNVQQAAPGSDASDTEGNTSGSEPSSDKAALRDVEILSSLPGVGNKVLATLISEASALLNDRDYQALRCLYGVAPVTRTIWQILASSTTTSLPRTISQCALSLGQSGRPA